MKHKQHLNVSLQKEFTGKGRLKRLKKIIPGITCVYSNKSLFYTYQNYIIHITVLHKTETKNFHEKHEIMNDFSSENDITKNQRIEGPRMCQMLDEVCRFFKVRQ